MDLSLYKLTTMEEWINTQYLQHDILNTSDLDIDLIASIFNAEVIIGSYPSHVQWDGEFCVIFINSFHRQERTREIFFHELCHPIRHVGNQKNMPQLFVDLQEIQATQFQLYAAMPVYMLEEFKKCPDIHCSKSLASEFRLPEKFVIRRLEQIQQRIFQAAADQEIIRTNQSQQKKYNPANWSEETRRIMDKLHQLRLQKGVY